MTTVAVLDKKLNPIFTGPREEALDWLWKNYRKNNKICWITQSSPRQKLPAYSYMHSDLVKKVRELDKIKPEDVKENRPELLWEAFLHYVNNGWTTDGGGSLRSFLEHWHTLKRRRKLEFMQSLSFAMVGA